MLCGHDSDATHHFLAVASTLLWRGLYSWTSGRSSAHRRSVVHMDCWYGSTIHERRGVNIIQFLQDLLASPSVNPPIYWWVGCPCWSIILFAAYDVTWRPTVLLGGLGEDGWRTAAAKAYPPRLCEILARNYLWYADSAATSGSEIDPPELAAAIKALCRWDPYSDIVETFFSDYHCRTDM